MIDETVYVQGTLPFIARRVQQAWQNEKTTRHTPIDDLESFVWVMVWIVLYHNGSSGRTVTEKTWWEHLSSHEPGTVNMAKEGISLYFAPSVQQNLRLARLSSSMQELAPLLQILFGFADEMQVYLQETFDVDEGDWDDDLEELVKFAYIRQIFATWDHVSRSK